MTEEAFPGFAARMEEMRNAGVTPQRLEMRRLADAMRLVIERLVATRAPQEQLAEAATALEAIAAQLEGYPQGHTFEGFAAIDGSDRIFTTAVLFPDGRKIQLWFGDPNASQPTR